jgi:Putative serine esterase (DUF676)
MSERSELISVVNTKDTTRSIDVIFVHGINADPRKTWMVDNKLEGFPEESWLYWVGKDIPDVAVWTLGYPASASGWKGFTMELKDRADNIINLLLNHPDLDNNRTIIFVAHSMGGLLVKHILRRIKNKDYPNADSLAERTKGIVFLSTPHRGAELANFIEYLSFLLPNANIRELKQDEPTLIELNNWFCQNFNTLGLQVKVFCEAQPTPVKKGFWGKIIRKIVVDKNSAYLALPDVSVTLLDANHSSICWVKKYHFRHTDQLYSNIIRFINNFLEDTSSRQNALSRSNTTIASVAADVSVSIEGSTSTPLGKITYYTIISQNAISGVWSIGGFQNEPVEVNPLGPSHKIYVEPTNTTLVGESFIIAFTAYSASGESATATKRFLVVA